MSTGHGAGDIEAEHDVGHLALVFGALELTGTGGEDDKDGEKECGEGVDGVEGVGEPLGVLCFLMIERKRERAGVGAPLEDDQDDRQGEGEKRGWMGEGQGGWVTGAWLRGDENFPDRALGAG